MKSTIKIKHGANNRGQIEFKVSKDTEDPRDFLCKDFIEQLGMVSNYCIIEPVSTDEQQQTWLITPVTRAGLQDLHERVGETLKAIAVHDKMLHG